MTNDIKIDWKKYVDKIYCITWTGSHESRAKLWSELKRVDIDINDHELFLNFENITTPLYKDLCDANFFSTIIPYSENKYCYLTNVIYAQYYCMKHAQNYKYERILILEDDVVFLKNKEDIVKVLDNWNEISKQDDNAIFAGNLLKYYGIDFAKVGWSCKGIFYYYDSEMIHDIRKVDHNMSTIGTTAFTIYTKKVYEYHIKRVEENHLLTQTDYFTYYRDCFNIYYNETNICIQWKDMFNYINWFYLYNLDIYEDYIKNLINKENILEFFKESYENDIIYGQYVLMNKVKQYYIDFFNQINFFVFNNKLKKEDYIL